MTPRQRQIKDAVTRFTELAKSNENVIEIAQFGSSITGKKVPKDFDLMVFVDNITCIPRIARCARSVTSIYHAHDIFVFGKDRRYMGRICSRKNCPGDAADCFAPGCGKTPHLKQISGFTFREEVAFKKKPLILYKIPGTGITESWYNEAKKYMLKKSTILRKEYFGGIAFNRDNAATIQVDGGLYEILAGLHSKKSIKDIIDASKNSRAPSCIEKLEKLGFITDATDQEDILPYTPNETIEGCLSAPEVVHLSVTGRCNLDCEFCYAQKNEKDMTTKEITSLIDELSEMKVFQVAIGGGEPLLRDDIYRILSYCKKKGIVANITTNGTLLEGGAVKKLKKIAGQVNLSVNECLKTQDCRDRILMLACAGIRTGINLMASKKNIGTLENTIQDLLKYPVESITLLRPKPAKDDAWYNENRLDKDDLVRLKSAITTSKHPGKIRVDCSLVSLMHDVSPSVLEYKSIFGCVGGVRFCTIRNNGDVYPCSFFGERQYLAGNVPESGFKKIWKEAQIFKTFRTMNNKIKGRCRKCRIKDNCKGCRRIALKVNNDFYSEDICPGC
ncbi:MAG: radical SAM protein [archaeon]